MSLFVAVIPPSHVIEDLHDTNTDVRRLLGARTIRWTAPDRWHLTLAFLGDPENGVDEDVAEHLRPLSYRGPITGARLLAAGVFGRQIAWIGPEDGPAKDALALIARRIPLLV